MHRRGTLPRTALAVLLLAGTFSLVGILPGADAAQASPDPATTDASVPAKRPPAAPTPYEAEPWAYDPWVRAERAPVASTPANGAWWVHDPGVRVERAPVASTPADRDPWAGAERSPVTAGQRLLVRHVAADPPAVVALDAGPAPPAAAYPQFTVGEPRSLADVTWSPGWHTEATPKVRFTAAQEGPTSVRSFAFAETTFSMRTHGAVREVHLDVLFIPTLVVVRGAAPEAAMAQAAVAGQAGVWRVTLPPATAAPATPAAPSGVPAAAAAPLDGVARWIPDPQFRPEPRRMLRWLPLLALRWVRGDDGLDQETRRRVYEFLKEHPGALAGDIADALGIRRQTAHYHLRILVREGFVVSKANGRTHYFRRDDPRRVDCRHILTPTTLRLLDHLGTGVTARELGARLGVTPRTVSWHLARLAEHGLVRRYRVGHSVEYRRARDAA